MSRHNLFKRLTFPLTKCQRNWSTGNEPRATSHEPRVTGSKLCCFTLQLCLFLPQMKGPKTLSSSASKRIPRRVFSCIVSCLLDHFHLHCCNIHRDTLRAYTHWLLGLLISRASTASRWTSCSDSDCSNEREICATLRALFAKFVHSVALVEMLLDERPLPKCEYIAHCVHVQMYKFTNVQIYKSSSIHGHAVLKVYSKHMVHKATWWSPYLILKVIKWIQLTNVTSTLSTLYSHSTRIVLNSSSVSSDDRLKKVTLILFCLLC